MTLENQHEKDVEPLGGVNTGDYIRLDARKKLQRPYIELFIYKTNIIFIKYMRTITSGCAIFSECGSLFIPGSRASYGCA